jgi:hypothetical protein
MIAIISHSVSYDTYEMQINSLEELLTFQKESGCSLIINVDEETGNLHIEVYDDYRE